MTEPAWRVVRRTTMRTPGLLLLTLVVAACGSGPGGPGAASSPRPDPTQEYTAVGTVLDDADGPVLCLGGVMESYPPQCGGPAVAGWSWRSVEHESAAGVRWGEYVVTGTWDGTTLTLTEDPREAGARDFDDSPAVSDFSTPCPEPRGGWAPAPPDGWQDAGFQRALRLAERIDGLGQVWGDDGSRATSAGGGFEGGATDPVRLVLDVTVAGDETDLAAAERALRAAYDGDVCVTPAAHSRRELEGIARELRARDDLALLLSSTGERVDLTVVHDDGTLQQELDAAYGDDVVEVTPALRPAG